MDQKEILSHVDHTQLKAFATWEDIQKLCEEAIEYQTASVCIPPCYIKRVHDTYGEKINICTVVGFPLGYSVTEAKAAETKKAFCKMCVTICGRFCPDEGAVAGYGNRIRAKYTAKWGVQIAGMIFQTPV